MIAAERNALQVAQFLLDNNWSKASINMTDADGNTAIMHAARMYLLLPALPSISWCVLIIGRCVTGATP